MKAAPCDPAADALFGQFGRGVEPEVDAAEGARVRRASDLVHLGGAVLYPAWHWVFPAVAPTSHDPLPERLAVGLLILAAGAAARTALGRRRRTALDVFLLFLVTGHSLSLLWRNQFSVPYLVGLVVAIASVGVIITEVSVGLSYAGLSLASLAILGQLSPVVPLHQELEALVATATVLAALVMGVHRTAAARRVAIVHIAKGRAALADLVQAIPDPVFLRARDMSLLFANEAGRRLETATGYDLGPVVRQELAAIAAARTLEQDVEVRTSSGVRTMSVKTAVAGAPDGPVMLVTVVRDVTERREMAEALRRRVGELEETRERLRKLQLMLPICMHCSNIRVSDGQWETLELYVSKISHTVFTHTLCKGCLERHYPALEGALENQD